MDKHSITPEHSDRARYVTDQVKLWLANDGQFFEAAKVTAVDPEWLKRLGEYLLKTAAEGSAAWQVSQELAPNDYERINWEDVAAELRD